MRRVIGAFFRSEVQSGRAPKTSAKQNATGEAFGSGKTLPRPAPSGKGRRSTKNLAIATKSKGLSSFYESPLSYRLAAKTSGRF